MSGIEDGATTTRHDAGVDARRQRAGRDLRVPRLPGRADPGPFAPCSSGAAHTASGFAPGVYTFETRATDAVGNVETDLGQADLHGRGAAAADHDAADPHHDDPTIAARQRPTPPTRGPTAPATGGPAPQIVVTLASTSLDQEGDEARQPRRQERPAPARR